MGEPDVIEVYVVYGAGADEVNGLYRRTDCEVNGAPIYRHTLQGDQLLSREQDAGKHGWVVGVLGVPIYAVRTEDAACAPKAGWRSFRGKKPSPNVIGHFQAMEASIELARIWQEEAENLLEMEKPEEAANVYKRALAACELEDIRRAQLHAGRARCYRQLAEKSQPVCANGDADGDDDDDAGVTPLPGLAAEWAITEAEAALKLDRHCFLAAWEGAAAAKKIGWWSKGRQLAKKAMEATPAGPQHALQRESGHALFVLLAEEEQSEKLRKVQETREKPAPISEQDLEAVKWASGVIVELNNSLKSEEFRKPHHQIWKLVRPGLKQSVTDHYFADIRSIVWDRWNPIAWQHGYKKTAYDVEERKAFCARVVDACNSLAGTPGLKKLLLEVEDRVCLDWPEIPCKVERYKYDETWAWTRREDGTWGAWDSSTVT